MIVKQEDRKPLTGCLGVTAWGTAVQGSAEPPSGILQNDSTVYISEVRFQLTSSLRVSFNLWLLILSNLPNTQIAQVICPLGFLQCILHIIKSSRELFTHSHLCWNKTVMQNCPQCKLTSVSFLFYIIFYFVCLKLASMQTLPHHPPHPAPQSQQHFWFGSQLPLLPQKPHFYPQQIPQYLYFLWEMRNCPATRSRNKKTHYGKAMIWLISSPKQKLLNKSKKLPIMRPSVYRTTFESTGWKEHLQQTFSPILLFCLSFQLSFHFCFAFVFCCVLYCYSWVVVVTISYWLVIGDSAIYQLKYKDKNQWIW